jgi:hypothetical protein
MNVSRDECARPDERATARASARTWIAALLCLAGAATVQAQDAATLKARYAESQERLANNPFGRPLFLESAQAGEGLKGDVYSVVEQPFQMVQAALKPADHWCDVLILHLNVKGCRSTTAGGSSRLALAVGKKFDQPVDEAYKLEFVHRVTAATADYLQVQLNADEGPLGTKDYRIRLEAVPIDARRSFIHMAYSYASGFSARMAMQVYLATIGSQKVGFSFTEKKPDGKPAYIGGVLGLMERNTMRYYLAIDAYLSAYTLPPADQPEKRIQAWYAATERYATQLHEMEQNEYIEMKRNEMRRQKSEAQ